MVSAELTGVCAVQRLVNRRNLQSVIQLRFQAPWCITLLKSKKTRILLFLFSLPSHPSAVSYGPRAIVWHPDARQTAQTSSRWLFTTLQCPTTASSHRALPWPTAPQNRPTQAAPGAPDPAVTIQKARGPAGWAGGTRRPGRERQQHAQGQQSGPAAGPDLPRPRICMLK